MSTFTRRDVERLAGLAKLELSADETERFARQLGDILEFVREVQAVDTSSLEMTADAAALPSAFRDDTVHASLDRAEALAAAQDVDTAAGLFKVPRVLNG